MNSVKSFTSKDTIRAVVIPTVLYLAIGGKHADTQTFQVLKTWKV
ncbi:MAG TPA: hypothetical protein VIF37_16515 [Methylobacter sp.]